MRADAGASLRRSHRLVRSTFALLLLCPACDAYDGELLPVGTVSAACGDGWLSESERCDTAIELGRTGACPTECVSSDFCQPLVLAGSECQAQCVGLRVSQAINGDRCCPEGIGAAEDSDCGECGDGVIGPRETCDPPETCATADSCARPRSCIVTTLAGDPASCNSDCQVSVIEDCRDDDGCCPSQCGANDDSDCSATCGNLEVESGAGETCEPASETAPCAESCEDGIDCTADVRAGSPDKCNVECANVPIEYAKNGDGCCPPGASAIADTDCEPMCGNAVVEGSEQCDGGAQCNASCERILHTALRHRYSFDGAASSAVVDDSVGGRDGSARNVTLAGDGSIALTGGTSNQYVELPCETVRGLSALTVEAWLSWGGGGARQRIFDFGTQDDAGEGTSYLLASPENSAGYLATVLNVTANAGDTGNDRSAVASAPLSSTGIHQVAVTFGDGTLSIYVDGEPVASTPGIVEQLSAVTFDNCWLGRAQFDAAPELAGHFYELRIYDAALTPGEVAISAAMGSDP